MSHEKILDLLGIDSPETEEDHLARDPRLDQSLFLVLEARDIIGYDDTDSQFFIVRYRKNIMKTSMQSKFETKMMSGAVLTVAQLQKMGFANPADAAYKARQKGLSVQRSVKATRTGEISQYSLEA